MATAHNDFLSAQFAGLPPLPNIEKLSDTVWRVLGGNPGKFQLQGTNTYLIGSGKERLLVDTAQGYPAWLESLRKVLSEQGVAIKQALITHRHHDHTGGIADLNAHYPGIKVYKHHPDDEIAHDPGDILDIADGQEFAVEGATLVAVHTPGHTTDHMCFVHKEENSLFSGDNVLGHGTTVFEDLSAYMQSLEQMKALGTERIYPGHGAVVEDGQAKLKMYIMHRKRREQQILFHMKKERDEGKTPPGLHRGAITSLELVKRIYTDVDEGLYLAAEGSTIQVLEKLQKEGVVGVEKQLAPDGRKRWYLTGKSAL